MSLNHPSLVIRTHDLERDLLRTIADYGPQSARYPTERDFGARAASARAWRGVHGVGRQLLAARQCVGEALVALGVRLQGPSSAAGVLTPPGRQGVGA